MDEHSNENNVATLNNEEDGGSAGEEKDEGDKTAHDTNENGSELYYEGPETPTPSLKGNVTFPSPKTAISQDGSAFAKETTRKERKYEHTPLNEVPVERDPKEENKELSPNFSQEQTENKQDEGLDNLSEGNDNDNTRVNEDTDVTDTQESEHEINGSDTENTDMSEQEEIQKIDKLADQNAKSIVKEGDANTEDYESVLKKLLGALGRFFGSWFSWLTTKMSSSEAS